MITPSFKRLLIPALAAALSMQMIHAQAIGLLEAYKLALRNDPILRSAVHENAAGQQAEAIGLAGLLPNLAATHTQSENRGTRDFTSEVSALTLRQPLFNMEAMANYRQGEAQANSNRAKFTGQSQQLAVRLVEAYVGMLFAQDRLMLMKAQQDEFKERMRVNEYMLKKGEGTTTDVLETQSKYALAQVMEIEAQDELEVARQKLAAIVGQEITRLDRLSNKFLLKSIPVGDFESWRATALEHSAELVTQRQILIASKEELNKSRAGHAPRLDLVASVSRNKSQSFIVAGTTFNQASVGVEFNMPIYSGGRVNALTKQAQENHDRTEADLEAMTNKILIELNLQYKMVLSSARRIESLVLGVDSARLLIHSTKKSIQGGERINLDLLVAQQQLYTAEKDLAEARYNYLLAYLRLQLTAGTLALDNLIKIATYFIPEKKN